MDRLVGMTSEATAAEQLQQTFEHHPAGIQPLPKGTPGRAKAKDVGIEDGEEISFLVIGDHGGVKDPSPQNAVSYALQGTAAPQPAFVYTVGDIVYFNGEEGEYQSQFYEPYAHVAVPIVGVPGNHDGEPEEGAPPREPLDAFMENFCDTTPSIPRADPHLEFGRHTQTQPYCDWTLELSALTIVGVYSNVPSGGHLEPSQIEWLTGELGAAREDKPLIVVLHHPPYSVDSHHGGSKKMGDILDKAFEESKRVPDMVLSGHVHDYQRFTRKFGEKTIRYLVVGNSGYHNLHLFAKGVEPKEEVVDGVTFDYGDAKEYGFLKLTVKKDGTISGEYSGVHPGTMPDGSDMKVTPGKDTF